MCREHVVKTSDHLGKKGNVKKPNEQLQTAVLYSTGGKTNLEMDQYLVILKYFISMRSACKKGSFCMVSDVAGPMDELGKVYSSF